MKQPRVPGLNPFSFAHLQWCHMEVLNLEQRVPATSGHVDYTAIRTTTCDAGKFLQCSLFSRLISPHKNSCPGHLLV